MCLCEPLASTAERDDVGEVVCMHVDEWYKEFRIELGFGSGCFFFGEAFFFLFFLFSDGVHFPHQLGEHKKGKLCNCVWHVKGKLFFPSKLCTNNNNKRI